MSTNYSKVRKRQRSLSSSSSAYTDDDCEFCCSTNFYADEEQSFAQSDSVGKHVKSKDPLVSSGPQHNINYDIAGIDEKEGDSFFIIYINGKVSRVDAGAPFVNTKKLFGESGILLQDVTIPKHPLLLLPCPHTGNVTVHPRRCYRLMKFIGEHLCLAGDFNLVEDDDVVRTTETYSMRAMRRDHKKWAMSELMGMMAFLRSNPHKTAEDFMALPLEEAAIYHSCGSMSLSGKRKEVFNNESGVDEKEVKGDVGSCRGDAESDDGIEEDV